MNANRFDHTVLPALVSFSVFLYFALMFALPSGYSYGSVLLLLSGLYFLAKRPSLQLTGEDKTIVFAMLSVFLWSLFIIWLHGNSPKVLDQTSRLLLTIPILLLLLSVPPRLSLLWAGVVVGVVLSNGIAIWQIHWLGDERAAGFLNVIHFGNIGLVFGFFCGAGMLWAGTQRPYARRWRMAFWIGILASLYAVMASGSRGSWTAIPPVLVLFFVAFLSKKNLKRAIAGGSALVIAIGAMYYIPETGVETRYDLAVSEASKYAKEKYVIQGEAVSSIGARLEVWRTALINIPQRPLLGWSERDYRAELERLVADKQIDPYMLEMANTHNNYLEVLVFQGVIGLLALLALYIVPFWFFCKRIRSPDLAVRALALSGSALVASYSMFSMSQVILGRNNGILFFALTLVILWACMRNEEAGGRVIFAENNR